MREIIFRGKRVIDGKWVQGYYTKPNYHWHDKGVHEDWIITSASQNGGWFTVNGRYAVDGETVGQYTGRNVGADKLFEGDIIEWQEDYDDHWGDSKTYIGRSLVIWDSDNACWALKTDSYIQPFNDFTWDRCYVVGNIHDNPELLR